MIYSELYKEGVAMLKDADILEAALDARLLLEYICGTNRNTLLAHPDLNVSADQENQYRKLIRLRASHIPLQQLTNCQEFMGLSFYVNEDVLIPRQDTEFLVEEVLKYAQDGDRILDMCTGSGCILLSLMNYKNNIQGIGVDLSDGALAVARRNAAELNMEATFLKGDLFKALSANSDDRIPKRYDVIVSNPPYIEDAVIDTLMEEVKNHEPLMALKGGIDGLDFYKEIANAARDYLVNYGVLFFEIGYNQAESVPKILSELGYSEIECLNDYAGNPRVVHAKYVR